MADASPVGSASPKWESSAKPGRLKSYFPQILKWFPSADSALAWRFLERWPDLQSVQQVSRQRLKTFLTRDARSCPADVDQFIDQIREAIPATQDRAVVNSSTIFVQGLVSELHLLRTTIQNYDKQIEAVVRQHPDFPIVTSFPGIGKALAPRLIAALGTQRERFPDASSIQSYRASRPCAKLAASANGSTLGGHVRSSSSRRFRNGPSIR